jgi:RNA polymerase sigma-70 factor, ECF subfamily
VDLGDPEVFRGLYREIQPGLLRYLKVLAGSDAEDVASETWLQVARDMAGFTGDRDGFRGWVITIGRHRALDLLRQRGRRPFTVPFGPSDLAERPADDDTEARGIEAVSTDAALRLIASLPPDQAEAVLLRAVAGLDAETAGKVIGKRAGAVRSAAHRGLRALASRLDAAGQVGAGQVRAGQVGDSDQVKAAGQAAASKGVTQPRGLALKDMR